jgi:hypothetical protein
MKESQFGEGTGTPLSQCGHNPNRPSYDPAADAAKVRQKMDDLVSDHWNDLTEWEKKFMLGCYSQMTPLTRKQHWVMRRIRERLIIDSK